MGYAFNYNTAPPPEEDSTFEGFTKTSLSMLDELDAFG